MLEHKTQKNKVNILINKPKVSVILISYTNNSGQKFFMRVNSYYFIAQTTLKYFLQ